jgi:putative DNA primase/helicase
MVIESSLSVESADNLDKTAQQNQHAIEHAPTTSALTKQSTILQALTELQSYQQWVSFFPSKCPADPRTGKAASSTDPDTWGTFEEAMSRHKSNRDLYKGVGFTFVKGQKLTGIDLDECIIDGKLTPWAQEVVTRLNSYTEVSPSGTGIHIWVRGDIPDSIGPNAELDGDLRTEMYDFGRYFTFTGRHLVGTPLTIEDRQEELLILYNEVVERRQQAKAAKAKEEQSAKPRTMTSLPGIYNAYGRAALEEECGLLASAPAGSRNAQLNTSAFKLGTLVGGNELSRADVERELKAAALQCGLDESETEKTMKSGIEAGIKAPRTRPTNESDNKHNTTNDNVDNNGIPQSPDNAATSNQQPRSYNLTDLGNAERFAAKYRDKVRWCETWNTWLIFNGKCWEPDKTGRVDQFGKIVVRSIYGEAEREPDDELRKRIAKHANASESSRSVRAMLDRAKSELPVTPDEFNNHLYLLNCNNGTLDLRTGELRSHSPQDMLTRCLKINYDPTVCFDKWEAFIKGIFAGDADLIQFMKEALGMSLSGDISEQCLFICHGSGSNGKTTMLETIRIIMRDYALAANIQTFQMRKNEGIGNDIAELYGARLVTASENALGSRLNEALIKKVTGKEPLRGRRLHENEFEFMPEFTLWLAVNHKPIVRDTSKGMWRRVHFIPFNVTIEGDKVNKHLGEELLEEAEGILAWLVQGCMAWHQRGHLVAPKAVEDATRAYRAEMDVIARFLNAECVFEEGEKVPCAQLKALYEEWCSNNGEKANVKDLTSCLNEKGFKGQRGAKGVHFYHGIGLRPVDGTDDTDLAPVDEMGDVGDVGYVKSKSYTREKNTNQTTLNLTSPTYPTSPTELDFKETDDSHVTHEVVSLEGVPSEHRQLFTEYQAKVLSNPVATLIWRASDSGFKNSVFGREEHIKYTSSLLRSGEERKEKGAVEAMKRTLGTWEG